MSRKSFRLLSALSPIAFFGGSLFAFLDGLLNSTSDAYLAAAVIMFSGGCVQFIWRCRLVFDDDRVIIVNPGFWHEIPYSLMHHAQAARGSGLTVRVKGLPEDEDEILVVGFAGSLIDFHARTAERAAKRINKEKKKSKSGRDGKYSKGLVREPVVELFSVLTLLLLVLHVLVDN
jgi:hypothetical protein